MSFRTARLDWLQSLGIAIGSGFIALYANISVAQITPDSTLPNNSNVKLESNTRIIEGGTTRGANLFHSFEEFSVPNGSTAFFNNAPQIQNILTRVTGKSKSEIYGLIKSNGPANLFLINPNGIIFGKNASLNIGGSFVATMANAIGFGNLGFFSASNPEAPSPLLTVNPNALLFNQIAAALIQNNSTAPAGEDPAGFKVTGLRVDDGKSLLLVGGDIKMDGGRLNALGGRVELGGLAGTGIVGLNGDGNNLSLSFPNSVERSDVFLSNGAQVNVIASNGGSIAVNARNLEMTGESGLFAGIESGLGSNNSKAGNISINTTGAINLNNSFIHNQVGSGANGQAGDVSISASSLRLEGGAQVFTGTLGAGKGGNLSVDAQDVQIIGKTTNGQFSSGLFASAQPNSTGDAGDLTVKTNTLQVRDGAQVITSTFSTGKGGNLSVDAQDVQIIGTSANGKTVSGLLASAQPNSTGDAGDLTIKTNTLLVRDGAQVITSTFGAGKGGNLSVDAQDVQIIGISGNSRFTSGLFASAVSNSTGNAGNLTVKTNTLQVRDGAQVSAGTFGTGKGGSLSIDAQDVQIIGTSADGRVSSTLFASAEGNSTGNAGDLTIKTNTLLVRDGAQVATSTFGTGKGGSLSVDAQDIQLIGTSADGKFNSGLFAGAKSSSAQDAGDLTIKTNTLLVRDGAQVATGTSGAGKGGSLSIDAQNVQLIGISANGRVPSSLLASTTSNSTGDAGDLTIKTNTLLVRDGSQVSAGTLGAGKGGSLSVDAQDVELIGKSTDDRVPSGLFVSAQSNSTGDAGDLTVRTNTLLVQDGSKVGVESRGTGIAGNMTLNARSIRLNNNALLSANTGSPEVDPNREQATININSKDLILTRNSNIRTDATGENVFGGNININADVLAGSQNSDISANSTDFRGGNVRINTKGIFGIQFRDIPSLNTSDITATGATRELSGNVQITRPDINPTNGLIQLPTNLVNVSQQISTACTPGSQEFQSTFVSTGRGGLPISPTEPLQDTSTLSAWVRLRPKPATRAKIITISPQPIAVSNNTKIAAATTIVEATGWVVDRNGNIELVALPQLNLHSPWQTPASCPISQGGVKYGKTSAAKASS
nr:filamentous hemagglutinin N-terminal domain-containing protein [Nostoc sp. ChiSLP03a]MDZ8210246.1 filamentous hemagglutinin N-terminal domain-containing protein [Nostoc sp. ChiSLP03a]